MLTWLAILCCHLRRGDGERSHLASLTQTKKETYKKKRFGHRMIHRKSIWKPGIGKIAKVCRGIAPGPHKGGLTVPHMSPSCKDQRADVRWIMAYERKTQSFMKNRGQQKCLDKALEELRLCKSLQKVSWKDYEKRVPI